MPRIGITCEHLNQPDSRGTPTPRFGLQASYVNAVAAAGGDALLLASWPTERLDSLLDILDGVVLSGSAGDVPPSMYGATPHPLCGPQQPERSDFELALLRGALARKLPVLGVCGGFQLMNVAFGGSLHQDLSLRPNTGVHQQTQTKATASHGVALAAGSMMARIHGTQALRVNSTHHQVVDRVGDGLIATAHAEDGVIEAVEHRGHAFVLAVQWHPEALPAAADQAVYRALVDAARHRQPHP